MLHGGATRGCGTEVRHDGAARGCGKARRRAGKREREKRRMRASPARKDSPCRSQELRLSADRGQRTWQRPRRGPVSTGRWRPEGQDGSEREGPARMTPPAQGLPPQEPNWRTVARSARDDDPEHSRGPLASGRQLSGNDSQSCRFRDPAVTAMQTFREQDSGESATSEAYACCRCRCCRWICCRCRCDSARPAGQADTSGARLVSRWPEVNITMKGE